MKTKHRLQLLSGILLVIFGTLIFVGLWRFGTILGFFLFYPWVLGKVTGMVINPHLAKIVALLATIVIYFGVYRGLYKHNHNWGYAALIGLMILQSTFMLISEQDRFFSMASGDSLKYSTVNPISGELQVFDAPVFDAFGQKALPVDFKTAQEIYRQQNADKYPNEEVPFDKIKNFFDARTGKPLVYYCRDGQLNHFFVHSGYDPKTGLKLAHVSSDVILKQNRFNEAVCNTPIISLSTKKIADKFEQKRILPKSSSGPIYTVVNSPAEKRFTYLLHFVDANRLNGYFRIEDFYRSPFEIVIKDSFGEKKYSLRSGKVVRINNATEDNCQVKVILRNKYGGKDESNWINYRVSEEHREINCIIFEKKDQLPELQIHL